MKQAALPKFIADAPLYREEILEDPAPVETLGHVVAWPTPIDRHCHECGPTKWEGLEVYDAGLRFGLHPLTYHCRNCKVAQFSVWLSVRRDGNAVRIMKVGQVPRPEIFVEGEFEKALGDRRWLYVMGMTARHNGYGIGAVPYLRRLIEETTDEMLEILEDAMKATGTDAAAIASLKGAREGRQFVDKVKLAAEVIPTYLRPGGVNPFGDLHDLLSICLHGMTDEECCDIVDAMDEALRFVYTEIRMRTRGMAAYEAAAKKIQDRRTKAKRHKEGGP